MGENASASFNGEMAERSLLSVVEREEDTEIVESRVVPWASGGGTKVGYLTDVSSLKVCMSNGEDLMKVSVERHIRARPPELKMILTIALFFWKSR